MSTLSQFFNYGPQAGTTISSLSPVVGSYYESFDDGQQNLGDGYVRLDGSLISKAEYPNADKIIGDIAFVQNARVSTDKVGNTTVPSRIAFSTFSFSYNNDNASYRLFKNDNYIHIFHDYISFSYSNVSPDNRLFPIIQSADGGLTYDIKLIDLGYVIGNDAGASGRQQFYLTAAEHLGGSKYFLQYTIEGAPTRYIANIYTSDNFQTVKCCPLYGTSYGYPAGGIFSTSSVSFSNDCFTTNGGQIGYVQYTTYGDPSNTNVSFQFTLWNIDTNTIHTQNCYGINMSGDTSRVQKPLVYSLDNNNGTITYWVSPSSVYLTMMACRFIFNKSTRVFSGYTTINDATNWVVSSGLYVKLGSQNNFFEKTIGTSKYLIINGPYKRSSTNNIITFGLCSSFVVYKYNTSTLKYEKVSYVINGTTYDSFYYVNESDFADFLNYNEYESYTLQCNIKLDQNGAIITSYNSRRNDDLVASIPPVHNSLENMSYQYGSYYISNPAPTYDLGFYSNFSTNNFKILLYNISYSDRFVMVGKQHRRWATTRRPFNYVPFSSGYGSWERIMLNLDTLKMYGVSNISFNTTSRLLSYKITEYFLHHNPATHWQLPYRPNIVMKLR